jgi:hypothetical protein
MARLLDFEGLAGHHVLWGGPGECTGKLSTLIDGLCIPLRSAKYAQEVNRNSNVAAAVTKPEVADLVDQSLALALSEDPDPVHAEIHAVPAARHQERLRAEANEIYSSATIDTATVIQNGLSIGRGADQYRYRCHARRPREGALSAVILLSRMADFSIISAPSANQRLYAIHRS